MTYKLSIDKHVTRYGVEMYELTYTDLTSHRNYTEWLPTYDIRAIINWVVGLQDKHENDQNRLN